jgi:hypothetical protein
LKTKPALEPTPDPVRIKLQEMLGDEFMAGPSNWGKATEWLMVSEKARYWMAVGVAALFLGNSFMGGHSLTSRFADHSRATAQRISGQAVRYATLAQAIFGRGEGRFVQTQTATAHAQTRLAFMQTAMVRREAALAKVQTERIRVLANHPVACPRQNLVINLHDVPEIADEGTI